MLVVAAVTERLSTPSEPCQQELPLGVPHLAGVSIAAIALGWIGAISSLVSLASAGARVVKRLCDPGGETRWAAGGHVLFLVLPVAVLLANIFTVDGFYSLAIGHLVECT
jgi:hypothetical protein